MDERKLNIETKESPVREVWVIDDNECTYLSIWQNYLPDVKFKQYFLAKEALSEIDKRVSDGKDVPEVIFMDGRLQNDHEPLYEGAEVVKVIRALDIKQPIIAAYSSGGKENSDMVGQGANLILGKGKDYQFYLKFLKDPKSFDPAEHMFDF